MKTNNILMPITALSISAVLGLGINASADTTTIKNNPAPVITSTPVQTKTDVSKNDSKVNKNESSDTTSSDFVPGSKVQFNPEYRYQIENTEYGIWDTPYNDDSELLVDGVDYPTTQFRVVGTAYNDKNKLYVHITNDEEADGWIFSGALAKATKKSTRTALQENLEKIAGVTDPAASIVGDLSNMINTPLATVHNMINYPLITIQNVLAIPATILGMLGL